jgi:hypothetical protein
LCVDYSEPIRLVEQAKKRQNTGGEMEPASG